MPRFAQQTLDEWFPTFIRYLGALLVAMLICAQVFLGVTYLPGAYAAAGGMILYKPFERAWRAFKAESEKPEDTDSERWSHLP